MPFADGAVYAMSKAALQGLAQGLARDLGPRRIAVNNVQPGPVDTDMNPAEGEFAASMKDLMVLPRYGHADEIAAMVSYLAGPRSGLRNRGEPDDRRRVHGMNSHHPETASGTDWWESRGL